MDFWVEEVAMVDHQVEVELAILVVKLAISIVIVQRGSYGGGRGNANHTADHNGH